MKKAIIALIAIAIIIVAALAYQITAEKSYKAPSKTVKIETPEKNSLGGKK